MAAFAVSAYAAAAHRAASKPFNPLLAETYECVRADRGFRFVAEQVNALSALPVLSALPILSALHALPALLALHALPALTKLPVLLAQPHYPHYPTLPALPTLPAPPALTTVSELPALHALPALPELHALHALPSLSVLPAPPTQPAPRVLPHTASGYSTLSYTFLHRNAPHHTTPRCKIRHFTRLHYSTLKKTQYSLTMMKIETYPTG